MKYPKGYCDVTSAINYTGISKKKMLEAMDNSEIVSMNVNGKKLVNALSVLEYMEKHGIKMPRRNQPQEGKFVYKPAESRHRICLVCGRQFSGKQKLCKSCNARQKHIGELRAPLSALLVLKKWYPDENPFDIVERNPGILYRAFSETKQKERHKMVVDADSISKSRLNLAKSYKRSDIPPEFVKDLFRIDCSKELLYVTGSKRNPDVHFVCKRCGNNFCQTYSDLVSKKGHNCNAVKSSGECVVEDFLKRNQIDYLTQRQTLNCVNPKTGATLPYDFEIPKAKVVIEVQGEQHFRYTPYFHGSVENFEYGQWRDRYKREYAEKCGYFFLQITYDDILSGQYETAILSAITARSG